MTKHVLHIVSSLHPEAPLHQRYQTDAWAEQRVVIDLAQAAQNAPTWLHAVNELSENSADALYVFHLLEKLYPHQRAALLTVLASALKPGGELVLIAPDAQMVASFVASGQLDAPLYKAPSGPVRVQDLLYGYGPALAAGKLAAAHRSATTARSLAGELAQAGFSGIDITRRWLDLWCICHRYHDEDERNQTPPMIKVDNTHPGAHYPPPPPGFQFRHPGQMEAEPLTDALDVAPMLIEKGKP